MLSEQAEKREVAFPVLTPLWDDPLTASLAAHSGTPPIKECFSGSCIVFVTGRENDGTGLYYYRARYYSPRMQRFISEDPIGFGGGDVNLYAYVGNNPVNFRDPLGLFVGCIYFGGRAYCADIQDTNGNGYIEPTNIIVVTGDLPNTPQCGYIICVFDDGRAIRDSVPLVESLCLFRENCPNQPPPKDPPPPRLPPGPPGPPPCGRKC